MENWRDYVGYQPISLTDKDPENTTINLFFLTSYRGEGIELRVLKEQFDLSEVVLTDEEVGSKVEELLLSFPKVKLEAKRDMTINDMLIRNKEAVATASRRGRANTNYNDTWFYKGVSPMDAPIIVCGLDDKYYVFSHPNFKLYGFNVT